MPEVVQHALSVLWHLLLTFGAFVVAFIITDPQDDFLQFLAAWLAFFSFYFLWLLPNSKPATFLFNIWYRTPTILHVCAALIVFSVFVYQAVGLGDPAGMKYLIILGMMLLCTIKCNKLRPEAVEPDEAVEPEQSDSPAPSAASSALVLFPVAAHRCGGSTATAQPWIRDWARSAARKAISFIWRLFVFVFVLGLATVFFHALIDVTFRDLVGNPVPMDRAPRFETEPIIQPKLPIDVPFVTAFTTSDVIPPTASPTPTPVARRTWRVAAISTPMPTPTPTPTAAPEPSPEPEAARVVFSVEPLEFVPGLLNLDLLDPTPVLEWYFDLPRPSQDLYIALTLLLCWYFSGLLLELVTGLAIFAAAYLISAAILALLLIYQFTPEQSLAIALPVEWALFAIIYYARLRLRRLASVAGTNAADLAKVSDKIESLRSMTSSFVDHVLDKCNGLRDKVDEIVDSANNTIDNVNKLMDLVKDHGRKLADLFKAKASTDRDLAGIRKQLNKLSKSLGSVRGLSQEDCDLLIEVRDQVKRMEATKADKTELDELVKQLQMLEARVENSLSDKADKTVVNEISKQLKDLIGSLAAVQRIQSELVAGAKKVKNRIDGAQADIKSLNDASKAHDESISMIETNAEESRNDISKLQAVVTDNTKESGARISKLEQESKDNKRENADLRNGLNHCQGKVEDMQSNMQTIEAGQVKHDDLQQVRKDASDASQKVDQLRAETDSQHGQAMQATRDLEARVDSRVAATTESVAKLEDTVKSLQTMHRGTSAKFAETDVDIGAARTEVAEVNTRLDTISDKIDNAIQASTDALQRVQTVQAAQAAQAQQAVQAVQPPPGGWVSKAEVDAYIHNQVVECMKDFMVSDSFHAAVNHAQLTKKQIQQERLRAQVHAAAEELLGRKEIQEKICANIMERQALDNNLSGDPAEVVSEGRASSPGVGPSDSNPADDNTTGNDDPPGDPPGVISGGRATLPCGMSSDDDTTSATPEDSTTSDDAGDHHGARGAPHGEPPGGYPGGHAGGLGGSTSDGPSDDGGGAEPRPSGEDSDDDDTPRHKQWKGKGPAEPDNLTYEQLYGPATLEQPGGEQVEETEEEETDYLDDNAEAIASVNSVDNTEDNHEGRLLGDFLGRMLAREEWPDKKKTRRKSRKAYAMAKQRAEQQSKKYDENDDDDDANDGDDGHESDDDGPPGPPPGNGGSHGDSGAGGDDADDDDQDGDDDGAPGPAPSLVPSNNGSGLASSRHAPGPSTDQGNPSPPRGLASSRFAPGGLANSRYAPDPSSGPSPSPATSNHPSGLANSRHATGPSPDPGTSNPAGGLANSRFAPGPTPGPSTPSRAPGLASSRFAPGPSTGSLSPQGPGSADGDPVDAQEANDDGSEHLPASKPKHNAAQNLRASMDSNRKAQTALRDAIDKLKSEKAEQQPWATQPSNQLTPAQLERRTTRERLRHWNNQLEKSLERYKEEHTEPEKEQERLEQAGGQPESAREDALARHRQRIRAAETRLEQGKGLYEQTSERQPRPEGWVPPPGPHKKHRRGKRGKGGKGNGGGGAGGSGPGP